MIQRIAFTFLTKFSGAVLNFTIVILLSQVLGADGKGVCSLILSTIAVFAIVSDFVGGPTLVYLVPRYALKALLLPAYVWTLLVAVLFLFILNTWEIVPVNYVGHVIALSVVNAVAATHLNVLLGQERSKLFNVAGLVQSFSTVGALVALFFINDYRQIDAYLLALYTGFGLSAAITTLGVYLKKAHHQLQVGALKEMIRLGVSNQLAMVAQFLSYRIGFYFLEQIKDTRSVGIYSNAVSIAEAIWLTGHAISTILYARIANNTDAKVSGEMTVRLARLNTLLTLSLVIPVACLPDSFFTYLFGKDFTGVSHLIHLLLPGILIFNLTMICSNYFAGTGRYLINTLGSGIGLVVTLISSYWLIPLEGTAGAAIAATASYTATTLFTVIYFVKSTPHTFNELLPKLSDIQAAWRMLNLGGK
jgi:O-antigen/teichoic acid export membrane protein